MKQIGNAVGEIYSLDELAMKNSVLHNIHPLPKLISVLVYIIAVMSFDRLNFSGLIMMLFFPLAGYYLADISILESLKRMRFILPIVVFVGIFNPIFDREIYIFIGSVSISRGFVTFITLLMKGVFALLASYLLIATTSIEKICYALRLLKVPGFFVTLILITFRYVTLLLLEAEKMVNAYKMRAPKQKGVEFSAWGSFLGSLLLRTSDRATALYQSMQLRGFKDDFCYVNSVKAQKKDYFYLFICVILILAVRLFNVAAIVGSFIV